MADNFTRRKALTVVAAVPAAAAVVAVVPALPAIAGGESELIRFGREVLALAREGCRKNFGRVGGKLECRRDRGHPCKSDMRGRALSTRKRATKLRSKR
jgi:hypothetical protein